jgi:hypothetical protein
MGVIANPDANLQRVPVGRCAVPVGVDQTTLCVEVAVPAVVLEYFHLILRESLAVS